MDEIVYVKISKNDNGIGEYTLTVNDNGIQDQRKKYLAIIGNDEYFSDLYDDGKLYMNDIRLTDCTVRAICSSGDTVYFAAENGIYKVNGLSVYQVVNNVMANSIDADSDHIYFNNWNDGGKIYALNIDDGSIIQMNNDPSTWIKVIDGKVYYYSMDDGVQQLSIQ